MDNSGVVVPQTLGWSEWERCPDWDSRPVFRFSSNQTRRIFWLAPRGLLESPHHAIVLDDQRWYRVRFDDASASPSQLDIFTESSDGRDARLWLSVELESMQPVDLLVDRFGMPPDEVQRDWKLQLQSSSLTKAKSTSLLAHLLVTPDGRLFTLESLEAALQESVSNENWSPLETSLAIPDECSIVSACKANAGANLTLAELLPEVSSSAKSDLKLPESTTTPENLAKLPSEKSFESANLIAPSPVRRSRRKQPRSDRDRSYKVIYFCSATGLALLIGIGIWVSGRSKKVVQHDHSNVPLITKTSDSDPANELPDESDPQANIPLELTPDSPRLPESLIESQASNSLESLIGQIAGGKPPASIDSISFKSITESLNQTNEESIVTESLAEVASEKSFDPSKVAMPFSESLDDAANQVSMTEVDASTDSVVPETATENPTAPSFVTQTFSIRQAQSKSTHRVPFKVRDRQAVCRIKIRLTDSILLKPTEPILLAGRQDTVWTVALDDDSFQLNLYLRSIPAHSWYIATAVRLKMGMNSEIPIGKNDATQVCLRLQNYLRWLDQSRQLGESMRSNRKTRSAAIAGLEQIEKQAKSTENLLKKWLEIEKLVLAFYQENSVEMELAASQETLPE